MKKLFFYLGALCFLAGCSQSMIEEPPMNTEPKREFVKPDEENHFVSLSHLETLLRGDSVLTRGDENLSQNIECLTNTLKDTVLFVYKNPEGGWKMYSTDTRVPAIVAESENGSFDELMNLEPARMWIESMMEDMSLIKESTDEELNFTKEEIAENKNYWKAIISPNEFVMNLLSNSDEISPLDLSVSWPGHYEFRGTTTYVQTYDQISRFTETNWHQDSPYNTYCPLKSVGSGRAPAGCVAIAGAQILYYFHYKTGIPEFAPSRAYCYGNVDSQDYNWAQNAFATDIWDYMNLSGTSYAAPLIAYIGRLVKMKYGNDASTATNTSLINNVFKMYGIPCEELDYTSGTQQLENSLLFEKPVIISASRYDESKKEYFGHMFYTDSYQRTRKVTEFYYAWVFETPPPTDILVPRPPDKVTYSYSSPEISSIGINWGWGSSFNQPAANVWYALTGNWVPKNTVYNYNINRKIIVFYNN